MFFKILFFILFVFSSLNAKVLTQIAFDVDEEGNINPTFFLPVEYGKKKQFYTAIGYNANNLKTIDKVDGFEASKNAYISSQKNLILHFFKYRSALFGYKTSFGFCGHFSKITNNEFGYIQDKDNVFNKGEDYYLSFDNETKLFIQEYALAADIVIPMGKYFVSKLSASLSPYRIIDVEQLTLFKPLVEENGYSKSSTKQNLSYILEYALYLKAETFIDLFFEASYKMEPFKYDLAQVEEKNKGYIFELHNIDKEENTIQYKVSLLLDKDILENFKPLLSYGIRTINTKNNLTNETTQMKEKFFTIGVGRVF